MEHRLKDQDRLERLAREIDAEATVRYIFDDGAFIVSAPERRDVPLSQEFVADRVDREVIDEIRRRWGLR